MDSVWQRYPRFNWFLRSARSDTKFGMINCPLIFSKSLLANLPRRFGTVRILVASLSVLSKIRLQLPFKIHQRILYRQRQPAPQRTKRPDFEGFHEVVEQGAVYAVIGGLGFVQHFRASGGADAAGETLAAAFVGRKFKQVLDVLDQRVVFGDTHHGGMAEQEAVLGEGLEVHREVVNFVYRHEAAERAADVHGFHWVAEAAAEFVYDRR